MLYTLFNLSDENPLLQNLGQVLRVRKGSKASRFFRLIFEHKSIKRLFGANLAALALASTLLPQKPLITEAAELVVEAPVVLKTEKDVQYPVRHVSISQGYRFYHLGVDFDGITGDTVYPILPGTVEAVNYSGVGYGNAVYITHENDLASLYAHLSEISVKEGQEVNFFTKIGSVGSSGRSSGDHLHLEVRKNGVPVNPFSVLP